MEIDYSVLNAADQAAMNLHMTGLVKDLVLQKDGTFRAVTDDEMKNRMKERMERRARRAEVLVAAFAKLNEEEIEAIEAHFSEVFY